jgi:hypothetical protein
MLPNENEDLASIKAIKQMMERSGRFISLSGYSGIAAGACALIGAYLAYITIKDYYISQDYTYIPPMVLRNQLLIIAGATLFSALCCSFLFTFLKSRKDGVALWGETTRNLLWYTLLPMFVGAVFILRLVQLNDYQYLGAVSLIFYGLGLVNGSKFTIGNIRYLGYINILLGCMNFWMVRHSITLWALGFGAAHIIYGLAMWWQYDRKQDII